MFTQQFQSSLSSWHYQIHCRHCLLLEWAVSRSRVSQSLFKLSSSGYRTGCGPCRLTGVGPTTINTASLEAQSPPLVGRTYGRALAAYWSPDSQRLLILLMGPITGSKPRPFMTQTMAPWRLGFEMCAFHALLLCITVDCLVPVPMLSTTSGWRQGSSAQVVVLPIGSAD